MYKRQTYYNGKSIPGWVKKLRWYVVEVSGDRAVINKDESGRYAIMSPVKTSALAVDVYKRQVQSGCQQFLRLPFADPRQALFFEQSGLSLIHI